MPLGRCMTVSIRNATMKHGVKEASRNMSFDLHIPEESQRGRVIQMIISEQHITPEEVLEKIIDEGIKATLNGNTAADTPDLKRPRRSGSRAPNLDVADASPVFGMFAGKPEFSEAMDKVIATRENRYTSLT